MQSNSNLRRINIGSNISNNILKELYGRLSDISELNIEQLVNINTDKSNYLKNKSDLLEELFKTPYYKLMSRDYSNSMKMIAIEPKVTKGEAFERTVDINQGPISLVGVPDEYRLYCRFHPTEQGDGVADYIPNRDFMMSSYPWENLFCISDLIKFHERSDPSKESKRNLINSYIENKVIDILTELPLEGERIIDLCMFGLWADKEERLSNPGLAFRDCITVNELKDFFINRNYLKNANSADHKYDAITFKILPRNQSSKINISIDKSKETSKKPKSKTYVIFCDSLDLKVLDEFEMKDELSNIRELKNKSTHYNKFTSSGGWTYPCLHSVHTGLPPYITFSVFRHEPSLRLGNLKNKNYTSKNRLIRNSLTYIDTPINPDTFLTRQLSKANLISVGIKRSVNHGWFNGLTNSLDLSIENTTSSKTFDNLIMLKHSLGNREADIFFIDLDHFHDSNKFIRKSNRNWNCSRLDFLKMKERSRNEGLEGIFINKEIKEWERKLYMDKTIELDKCLGEIMSTITENDNIILFSDHGSDIFPMVDNIEYERPDKSTLIPELIFKPTLLVCAPNNINIKSKNISNELVSTIDLYNIILSLNGLKKDYSYGFSILPKSLGGNTERKVAYSFNATYMKATIEEKAEFELVERNANNKVKAYSFPYKSTESILSNKSHKIVEAMYPDNKQAHPLLDH